jgi:hypothetical protein
MTHEQAVERIYREIEHGDYDHRAWLYDTLNKSKTLRELFAVEYPDGEDVF